MTAGTLNMTVPSALTWTEAVNGLDQTLVDTTPAHQTYQVDDATGSNAGWNVTAEATAFADGAPGDANNITFATNGNLLVMADATAPTAVCLLGSTCTPPTNNTVYPVTIPIPTTPAKIYSAAANTGLGTITIGNVGWWLNVPANTIQGTYLSTVTLELITGP